MICDKDLLVNYPVGHFLPPEGLIIFLIIKTFVFLLFIGIFFSIHVFLVLLFVFFLYIYDERNISLERKKSCHSYQNHSHYLYHRNTFTPIPLPPPSTHLNHGDEVAEEAAEDPVLYEEDGEGERQQREAHNELTNGNVHKVCVGGVSVQAATKDVDNHGSIAYRTAQHEEGIQDDVKRVHGGEGGAEVRLSQVNRLVWEGLKVVNDLCQHLVGDAADVGTFYAR